MTKAKVVDLIYRSLNMLDPQELAENMDNAEPLIAHLRSVLGDDCNNLVVHIEEHMKIFSFVCSALVIIADELSNAGGELIICTSDPRYLAVMKMLGLIEYFEIFDSVEAALAARGWLPTLAKLPYTTRL